MNYDWDVNKSIRNIAERGIDFAIIEDFDWDTAIAIQDDRWEYDEARYRALGYIGNRLYAVAFTVRSDTLRIISLRKANLREVRRYEKGQV